MSGPWRWEAQLMPGAALSDSQRAAVGLADSWPSQGDAESWLGENYPELADLGVDSVTLYEGGRLVYGPMSLSPPA